MTALQGQQSLAFAELFAAQRSRQEVIVTFLALLELVRLRLVRLLQSQRFGPIWITPAVAADEEVEVAADEGATGYV